MDTMNRHYFSKTYKGFTISQTDRGWVIVNCPNWTRSGPVPDGPFATDGIARHVIDNILDDPNEKIRRSPEDSFYQDQADRERVRKQQQQRGSTAGGGAPIFSSDVGFLFEFVKIVFFAFLVFDFVIEIISRTH